jgi:chitin synthase
VSSATANPKTDAFNFLAKGAGRDVFDVVLRVSLTFGLPRQVLIIQQLYIVLIFVILVCSLGNRPQGSKWTYSLCILLFGICQIITLWCAGFTVYLAVPHTEFGWEHIIQLIKTNATLREIAISLIATYGLYWIGSIIHLEPWHMVTSFVQYMFFLPSYVNILMMYAMCNLHDVSWGTKGDNNAAKDLGGAKPVKGSDGKTMLEVELPSAREDVDSLWIASQSALRHKPVEEKQHRDAETKQQDHDRNSRTNVVLTWVGTNMAMVVM